MFFTKYVKAYKVMVKYIKRMNAHVLVVSFPEKVREGLISSCAELSSSLMSNVAEDVQGVLEYTIGRAGAKDGYADWCAWLIAEKQANDTKKMPVAATTTIDPRCESKTIRVLKCDELSVHIPNAFTPDENGLNDVFKPVIYGLEDIQFEESNYYTFEIFNRWGERVFRTYDPQKRWNGQSPNGEYYSQSEVFNWRVNIIFPDGAEDWVGTVTLVR